MNNEYFIDLPEIPIDRGEDLHGLEYLDDTDLTIFIAGNQYMVMEELLTEFQRQFPEIKKIFYETLPPRLELRQILAGGARFGDRIISLIPDVYGSVSKSAMEELLSKGFIGPDDYSVYLHNRIVLLVQKGNPKKIKTVEDLARNDIRISQPSPEYEDIAHYIIAMYRKAGGKKLEHRIMEEKRAEGTTIYTVVHHRETPLRLKTGNCDVGPVWATEAVEALKNGLPVEVVEPGEGLDQREHVNYYITMLTQAKNRENAKRFIDFVKSRQGKDIYRKYGFVPHG